MGDETTHVRVYEDDAADLYDLKRRGESYADVVSRLLDDHVKAESSAAN